MSFTDAIKDGFGKYVQFSGRSSRSAYWYWALFVFIVVIVTAIIDMVIGTSPIVELLAMLALILPGIALSFRRLHDTGRSAWWILIGLVPFGGIVLLVFYCMPSEGPNRFGDRPDAAPGTSAAYA